MVIFRTPQLHQLPPEVLGAADTSGWSYIGPATYLLRTDVRYVHGSLFVCLAVTRLSDESSDDATLIHGV